MMRKIVCPDGRVIITTSDEPSAEQKVLRSTMITTHDQKNDLIPAEPEEVKKGKVVEESKRKSGTK
jgi:hypothetical protein